MHIGFEPIDAGLRTPNVTPKAPRRNSIRRAPWGEEMNVKPFEACSANRSKAFHSDGKPLGGGTPALHAEGFGGCAWNLQWKDCR